MAEPRSSCGSRRLVRAQGRCPLSDLPDHTDRLRADLIEFVVFVFRGIAGRGNGFALKRVTSLPGHGFWPDDLPLPDALAAYPGLGSHRHVTDGYLLSLAVAHDGILATLDRGIIALAKGFPERLELVFG